MCLNEGMVHMRRIDKRYSHLIVINGGITQAANNGQGYKISESKGNFYKGKI